MTNSFYGFFSIALAGACAMCAAVLMVLGSRRLPGFLRFTYWKWLAGASAFAALSYFLYELDHFEAVLGKAIIAYGILGGVVLGGIIAAAWRIGELARERAKRESRAV
jgi:hypothetical protein